MAKKTRKPTIKKPSGLYTKFYGNQDTIRNSARTIAQALYGPGLKPPKINEETRRVQRNSTPTQGFVICYNTQREPLGHIIFNRVKNEIHGTITHNVRDKNHEMVDPIKVDQIHNKLILGIVSSIGRQQIALRLNFSDRWQPSLELTKKLSGVREISRSERLLHPGRTRRELSGRKRTVKVKSASPFRLSNQLVILPWGFKSRIRPEERVRTRIQRVPNGIRGIGQGIKAGGIATKWRKKRRRRK